MAEPTGAVRATGQCLCGGVRYQIRGPMRPVIACHCDECRRWCGAFFNATAARRPDVVIEEDGALAWYRSSDHARRGFCRRCGASLFYDPLERPYLAIAAGSLDRPTGLKLAVHIFTEEKGDYYELAGDVPHIPGGRHGLEIPKS